VAKLVMVVEVFVTERDGEHALPDERAHAALDQLPHPPVDKASGEPIDEADRLISRSEKQATRVRRDRAGVEFGCDPPTLDRPKQIVIRVTLCRHRAASPSPRKSFEQNDLR
jgi:hypothetical protein